MPRNPFKPRQNKTLYKKLKLKLDQVFSLYIRVRDADSEGLVGCITCPLKKRIKEMQCGHFQVRKHMATRFHVKNCNGQCGGCNMADGEQKKHGEAIDKKWGKGTAEEMERLARTELKLNAQDLSEMIELFQKETVELINLKGINL